MNSKSEKNNLLNYLKSFRENVFINEIYLIIKWLNEENYNILGIRDTKKSKFRIFLIFSLNILISFFLGLINLLFLEKIAQDKEICIARVKREKEKIEKVFDNLYFISDDVKNLDFSIFKIGSRRKRINFYFFKFLPLCIEELRKISKILKSKEKDLFTNEVLYQLVKRIPHSVVFMMSINEVFSSNDRKTVYTGVVYERFALIIEYYAKKYSKKLVVIPHGVESSEEVPGGYIGDVFYSSSESMANKLNALYNTEKFIYSENVCRKMYEIKNSNTFEKRVVFFTQPNKVKFMKEIIKEINKDNNKIYIKIHPLENQEEYDMAGVSYIEKIEDALPNSCCISYASTILLEAKYNNAIPVSIALLEKDNVLKGDLEFLNDEQIKKPKNLFELKEIIREYYKKNL